MSHPLDCREQLDEELAAGMVEETIRLDREPTQSELVRALQGSLPPIFDHFEEKLEEQDGQILDIRITAKGGRLSLEYGVGPID